MVSIHIYIYIYIDVRGLLDYACYSFYTTTGCYSVGQTCLGDALHIALVCVLPHIPTNSYTSTNMYYVVSLRTIVHESITIYTIALAY